VIHIDPLWASALLTVVIAMLVHFVLRGLQRRWDSHRRRRLLARARQGESRAAHLLARLGYTIEAEQVQGCWPVVVQGELCEFSLRADLLVRLGKRRYVVEVKTGNRVASIQHGPTRRQLLEYQLAYRADGVLLVDSGRGSVLEVEFPLR